MTKKKTDPIEQPATNEQPADNPNGIFTLGSWRGMTQWRCSACAFDTLNGESEIFKHYFERHVAKPAEKPALIQSFDKRGKPITPPPGKNSTV